MASKQDEAAQALRRASSTLGEGRERLARAGAGDGSSGSSSSGGAAAGQRSARSAGSAGSGSSSGQGGGLGGPGRGQGGSVGAQQPVGMRGDDSLVRGQPDPDGPQASRSYRDQPDLNPTRAPAYVATPEFRRQTEAALRREEIPPTRRRQVKEYFDALRPR